MSNLRIIIPAAGESRRFKDAGYETPKPLLNLRAPDGRIGIMLSHVIRSIPNNLYPGLIVALPGNVKIPGNLTGHTTPIYSTRGQADTVYQVASKLLPHDRVLVLDCDMILQQEDVAVLVNMLKIYTVTIAVTETFDPNASRVDTIPFPTRFVEKEPISQWGIVGARAFSRADSLVSSLKTLLDSTKEEPYLSTAINYHPGNKFAHVITKFTDLGTPDRVKENGWKIL